MLDYNKQFAEGVISKTNAGSEPTDAEYTQWVAQLRGFADQIHGDQRLAEPADKMADLAVQIAKLAPRPQTDSSAMPQQATAPRPSLRESLYISKEFNENLTVLEGACSG
ncbi:hypothetical protein [Mycobacterium sp. NPDC050441]|uniref:hypothetical protein n=1 Tax=Mycobacterium sp. NPDC050441 TaxID=3155403 RepID=UPI0033D0D66A